jgi:hypothetical protein
MATPDPSHRSSHEVGQTCKNFWRLVLFTELVASRFFNQSQDRPLATVYVRAKLVLSDYYASDARMSLGLRFIVVVATDPR